MTRSISPASAFQQVPSPATGSNTGRNTYAPARKFLEERYEEPQRTEVRAFMAWSIASGLAYAANWSTPAPECVDTRRRGAGRGLWTWEDCCADTGIPTMVLEQLHNIKEQALRPTAAFPADMRSLSPRMAIDLLGGNYSAAKRMVEDLTGHELPKALRLDRTLGLVGYGDLHDKALPLFSRAKAELPEVPGFSRTAAYLATVCDGVEPFSVGILRHTLFEIDMIPRLLGGKEMIEAKCRELYQRLGAYLDEDFSRAYTTVLDRVMREEWHVEEFDPEDPEPDFEQVLERLIIWQWHDNRCLQAGLFMGLSLLTGISPASLTAYAVSDARRRGYTYIDVAEVDKLAELVENASFSAGAGRCAKEIRGHAAELMDVMASKQGVAERLARVSRARRLEDAFWEFSGRMKTAA